MKRQIGFAEAESLGKKRVTKRQRFLTEMEKVVAWQRLSGLPLLMARDPFTQLVRFAVVFLRRAGNRHPPLQANLPQFLPRSLIKFASAVSLPANYQSVSKILFFCHQGLSASVHADT